ncbi:MAG: c-type cytochrome, partial [Verrucomicrobiota bacterium]
MQLPPGYHLELLVSEPIIREPVVTVFDGNGRMYVAEMRSYMQDADANGEKDPISRVSLHWSSKGDGVYDKHTVFVDNMVLPRMILPLKDSVLIQETFTGDVYEYRDTNNDGVADTKTLFHKFDLPRDNNLEHQPSGLVWAADNWIYSTYNAVRIRWTPKGVITESTAPNRGQWGMSQDNYGKTWVTLAGSDIGPINFQQPVVYGAFTSPNEEAPGYRDVYPLVGLYDAQPGMRYVRPEDGTLNHTTSAAGIDIYRGDRLPADLVGDLLYGEPVGRLVRRTKIEVRDGITQIRNAYDKSEFIRSADPYFRPVNLVTAPDGTIYITDMYRGIIQQGNWTRPGSYLRGKIDQYGLGDKINGGRIWRLVHDSAKPGPQPHMLDETPAQLVEHLSHPNGWWRDTAQKLIILSQDKSVVPALQALARTSPSPLARIHAIWTLEGLDALEATLVREKFKDTDSHVRVAAIRASETLYKGGQTALAADIITQCSDKNADVAIQGLLTANLLKIPQVTPLIAQDSTGHPSAGVKEITSQLLRSLAENFGPQFTAAQRTQLEKGHTIFLQLCFACHGQDGKGTPYDPKLAPPPGTSATSTQQANVTRATTLAPPLAGSATATGLRAGPILAVLHGLSGPVGGKTYDAQMVPLGGNEDEWIAAVLSYVRNSFGNQASLISAQDVAAVRAANPGRKTPWTLAELSTRLPQPVGNRDAWKFTSNRGVPGGDAAVVATPD